MFSAFPQVWQNFPASLVLNIVYVVIYSRGQNNNVILDILLPIVAASVVISPSRDYTTFENNASTFTFNCSGNGTILLWTVNGYSIILNNTEIEATPFILSPDGLTVSSQLIVPTTKANNNITVICIMQDSLFNHQSSNPVKLLLQGTGYNIFVYLFFVNL